MLNLRKGLGLLLVVTMLATLVVIPANVSAAAVKTVLADEGFEGATEAPSIAGATIDAGAAVFASGDGAHKNALGLGFEANSNKHGITVPVNATDGTIYFSADVYHPGSATKADGSEDNGLWFQIFADDEDSNVELLRSFYKTSTNEMYTTPYKPKANGDTTEQDYDWQSNKVGVGEWFRVEYIIDVANNTVSLEYFNKDNESVYGKSNLALPTALQGIKQIRFMNEKTCVYPKNSNIVDNIIVSDGTYRYENFAAGEAQSGKVYICEDFEGYNTPGKIEGLEIGKGVSYYDMSQSADANDAGREGVLAIGKVPFKSSDVIKKNVNISEGSVRVKFDAKVGASRKQLRLYMYDSDGTKSDIYLMNLVTKEQGDVHSIGYYKGGYGGDYANTQSYGWAIEATTNDDGAKVVDFGEWATYIADIDVTNHRIRTLILTDDGKEGLDATWDLSPEFADIAYVSIGQVEFIDPAQCNYIDNFSVTTGTEEELEAGVLVDEDFEGIDSELDIPGFKTYADVKVDEDGVSVVDYKTAEPDGEDMGNVLALGYENSTYMATAPYGRPTVERMIDANGKDSGKLNISFDVQVGHRFQKTDGNWDANHIRLWAYDKDGNKIELFRIYERGDEKFAGGIYKSGMVKADGTSTIALDWAVDDKSYYDYVDVGDWINVSAEFDLDAKKVRLSFLTEAGYKMWDNTVDLAAKGGITNIASFRIEQDKSTKNTNGSYGAEYASYVDNIFVTDENYKPQILWEEDFNGKSLDTIDAMESKATDKYQVTNAESVTEEKQYTREANQEYVTIDEAHGTSYGWGKTSANVGQAEIFKRFTPVSEDCVKATYSIYNNGTEVLGAVKDVSDKTFILTHLHENNLYYGNNTAKDKKIATLNQNEWYTIEAIVNLTTGSKTIKLYDKDGEFINEAYVEKCLNDGGTVTIPNVTLFNARVWSAYPNMGYIDDIKVERYVAPPALNNSKIKMTDTQGNVVENYENVTPGVTTIAVDFGTTMKEDTLNANTVKLEKLGEKTENISYNGVCNGTVYTMTVGGFDVGSTYRLTVDGSVANYKGVTMGDKFTLEFTTEEGVTTAGLVSLMDGDAAATLESIAKGDTLTINSVYENTAKANMTIVYVVGYYSGDSLVKLEKVEEKADISKGAGALTNTTTAPDMTNIDCVKVFMWEDLANSFPYCEPIVLGNN